MATNTTDEVKTKLNVKLRKNHFGEGDSFIGTVARNTAKTESLVTRLLAKNTGISEYTIKPVTDMLHDEGMDAFKNGQSIEVLGFGTLYVAPDGAIKGKNPSASDVKGFVVRYAPSKEVKELMKNMAAEDVRQTDPAPVINNLMNVYDGAETTTFTAKMPVRITGSNLRIGGKDSGVFLAPVSSEAGQPAVRDEGQWIKSGHISVNKDKWLEFFLPPSLKAGTPYRIVLRTSYLSGGSGERKTPLVTVSEVVQIANAEDAVA